MTKSFVVDKDQNFLLVGPGVFRPYYGTLTVAAENANDVDVTFQLTDVRGVALKQAGIVILFWITADTGGDYATGTALTTLTTTVAAQLIRVNTTGAFLAAYTNSDGVIVIRGTIAGVATRRLVAALPGASIIQSGTMTWA